MSRPGTRETTKLPPVPAHPGVIVAQGIIVGGVMADGMGAWEIGDLAVPMVALMSSGQASYVQCVPEIVAAARASYDRVAEESNRAYQLEKQRRIGALDAVESMMKGLNGRPTARD